MMVVKKPTASGQKKRATTKKPAAAAATGKIKLLKREIDGRTLYSFKDFAFARGTCDNKPDGTPCELGGHCVAGQCHWDAMALAEKGIAVI